MGEVKGWWQGYKCVRILNIYEGSFDGAVSKHIFDWDSDYLKVFRAIFWKKGKNLVAKEIIKT